MRADSVFDEPHLQPTDRPPPIPKARTNHVSHEPHLRPADRPPPQPEVLSDAVWDEPALLAAGQPPPDARATYAGRLTAAWARNTPARAWGTTLTIALAAGPFAVLIAMLKTRALTSGWAAVMAAPFTEELAKAAFPLLVVETRPHRFLRAAQPWVACIASGLVFSALENLLYIHVYFDAPDPAAARFRWIVCTALHTGCSCIAGLGVRRVWLRCRTTLRKPEPALVSVYLIVAMVVHGLYNSLVLLFT
jgi:hypothetical protein